MPAVCAWVKGFTFKFETSTAIEWWSTCARAKGPRIATCRCHRPCSRLCDRIGNSSVRISFCFRVDDATAPDRVVDRNQRILANRLRVLEGPRAEVARARVEGGRRGAVAPAGDAVHRLVRGGESIVYIADDRQLLGQASAQHHHAPLAAPARQAQL
mgnify:CR=1 FL=1